MPPGPPSATAPAEARRANGNPCPPSSPPLLRRTTPSASATAMMRRIPRPRSKPLFLKATISRRPLRRQWPVKWVPPRIRRLMTPRAPPSPKSRNNCQCLEFEYPDYHLRESLLSLHWIFPCHPISPAIPLPILLCATLFYLQVYNTCRGSLRHFNIPNVSINQIESVFVLESINKQGYIPTKTCNPGLSLNAKNKHRQLVQPNRQTYRARTQAPGDHSTAGTLETR